MDKITWIGFRKDNFDEEGSSIIIIEFKDWWYL